MPGSSAETTEAKQALKNYPRALLPGVFGISLAVYFYPPLEWNAVLTFGLLVGFVPIFLDGAMWAWQRLPSSVAFLRAVYKAAGIAIAAFAIFLIVNGALDRYPSVQVHTRVLSVSARQGRFGERITLLLAPWRAGQGEQSLQGDAATFSIFQAGEPVGVIVHRGVFGLQWYGGVEPYPPQ